MAEPLIILDTNVVSELLRPAPAEASEQSLAAQDGACIYLTTISVAARAYAPIAAQRRTAGRPMSHFGGQIAAIACVHGGAVATRNTADFGHCEIDVINPWDFTPEA